MNFPFSFWGNIKNAIITVLTSNTSSSLLTASASSAASASNAAWKAFDGNDSTYWSPAGASPGEWVQIKFITPRKVSKYRVLLFATKSWILSASNDGSSFTNLDSQTTQSTVTKNISNNINYLYYRITFSDPSIAAETIQFYGY